MRPFYRLPRRNRRTGGPARTRQEQAGRPRIRNEIGFRTRSATGELWARGECRVRNNNTLRVTARATDRRAGLEGVGYADLDPARGGNGGDWQRRHRDGTGSERQSSAARR